MSKQTLEDMDKGPWKVFFESPKGDPDRAIGLQSDDFKHDVLLKVSGDFTDNEQRRHYCDLLAKALNQQKRIDELESFIAETQHGGAGVAFERAQKLLGKNLGARRGRYPY